MKKQLALVLLSMFVGSTIQGAEIECEKSRYDLPIIINKDMIAYFANKPRVKIEVSVADATGKGDKALDFFIIEPEGKVENIPTTLSSILPRSEFLKIAICSLLRSGSEVLIISESLSEPNHHEKVNGFIGITQKDLPLDR
jgi:hypothetical protein